MEALAYRNSPERKAYMIAYNHDYYTSIEGRAKHMMLGVKNRSKKRGWSFTIDQQWVIEKLNKGACEASGLPFVFQRERCPWSPSLDRRNNALGYTVENTRVVCCAYNFCKSVFTEEEVLRLAEALCIQEKRLMPKV